MDYIKIAELANRCNVKLQQITEYYRLARVHSEVMDEIIPAEIDKLQKELNALDIKLTKLIKPN